MKYSVYGFFALLLAFFIISACNKYGDLPSLKGKLIASDSVVKINQPDSLLLVDAEPADSIHWNVAPAGFDSLVTKGNKALIFFKKSGIYKVTATDKGALPAAVSIKVTDSIYHPPVKYTTIPLTGDQITLVPHFYKSSISDSTYLSFVAQTKNYYCLTADLKFADSLVNNVYAIGFINVVQPNTCPLGDGPIAAVINFTQNQPGPLLNGTYPLTVSLNGKTYNGSIGVTSANITFNWGYTEGVLIEPKQIDR